MFTDTGTGEVNQARIVLRALDGKHIENGDIVEKHDRFHIRCTDLASNTYNRFFEVIDIIPTQTKGQGTLLTLECLGIEYHTQHIHVSKPFYFEDGFTVAKEVGDMYNENNGSNQPTLGNHNLSWSGVDGNALPDFTANNFEFGISEDTAYNRWMDLVEAFGASVSAGGALTFFELSFIAILKNAIVFRLRASGDNTPTVTIKNAKVTNPLIVGEQEGMISNPTGTNVLAWGSPDHGSLPVDFSKYESQLIQFIFRPEYVNTVTYPIDAKVKVTASNGLAQHYKSLIADNVSNAPPGPTAGSKDEDANWEQIDQRTEFGSSINYSLWTDGHAILWGNAGCDPSRTTFTNGGFWDINLVIWDDEFFRTWADAKAINDSQLDDLALTGGDGYSYDGTRTGFPRGFRVLVDSDSPSDDLANFANMIAEWNGSAWQKKYAFDVNSDKSQCAVIDEGVMYEWRNATTDWVSIAATDWANDCFHSYSEVPTGVKGIDLISDSTTGTSRSTITDATNFPEITFVTGSSFTQNINSAIKFKTTQTGLGGIGGAFEGGGAAGVFYASACGVCFRFPFPNNNFNAVAEGVGDLYGGGTQSKTEPSTLDIQNMHNTHDGLRGFNQGDSSEDLGQINSVAFWMNFSIDEAVNNNELNDEHRFRCFMIDTSDNIVYSDFVIEFSNTWQDVRLPIASFRIYRGRKPVYGFDAAIATLFPPKELEVINIFEFRNVKFIGIQYQPVYDKFGRYNPGQALVNENANSVQFNAILGGTKTILIDAFRFVKPLLVTSGQETTMNIEPTFLQRPNISVYDQLKNDVKSQLEVEKFLHKQFDIESSGDAMFDIKFADSFLLENDEIVFVASPNANETTNKIQLVAKRIEYSITKPQNGPGGLRRRINGAKVFT